MKRLAAFILVTFIFLMTNATGAAMVLFLGTYAPAAADTEPAIWVIILAVATWSAVCFLQGAIAQTRYWLQRTRS